MCTPFPRRFQHNPHSIRTPFPKQKGYQWFWLGRALKNKSGITPLLLLDEVAAHLDAGRRSTLYDEICEVGAQAWLTGTGPELFDGLGNRAQHLMAVDKDGKSSVVFQ